MAQAKLTWITLRLRKFKIPPGKSWIAPKITTEAVSIVFIIILDVREAEHEEGDNFELQLRERKHTFQGIIVSTGKNRVYDSARK